MSGREEKRKWKKERERGRKRERERQKRVWVEKRGGIDKKIKEHSEFYAELIWIFSSGSCDFKN